MNSKKATTVTMAVMDEDVILEIVVRLPLKYAIRCMVLNKNLFRLISQRKKALVSSAYPDIKGSIFCRYNHDTFKRITPGRSKISITIPKTEESKRHDSENPIILDSCNGVFLLNFVKERRICVFNPITGGVMPLSSVIKLKLSEATVALAVDLDAQSNFQFKLVFAQTFSHSDEETMWRFTVLVPSSGTSWLIKSPVELICSGDSSACCRYFYVQGCVYWADDENHSIIMFDVEKEKARSIDWPVYDTEKSAFLSGSSDGSLQSIYILQHEIEIHSYDQVKDGWQLKHKFTNIVSCPRILFCNGQNLLIADDPPVWLGRVPLRSRKDPEEVLFMYDILSDKWETISQKDFSVDIYDPMSVFSFVPTLAKVSDKYLVDPDIEFAEVYLRGLQCLVMQETSDMEVIG